MMSLSVCTALAATMAALSAQGQPKFQIVHAFGQPGDGQGPYSSIVFDQQGNMYGTAVGSGAYNFGVVFELTPNLAGGWDETIVHAFRGQTSDGAYPESGVTVGQASTLYGTTQMGGEYGYGTVYEIEANAGGWTENVLHSFKLSDHVKDPFAGVVQNAAGDLFGNGGGVFEMVPENGGWTFTTICSQNICSYTDYGGLALLNSGILYGDTASGGPYHVGSVYAVVPGNGGWAAHTLFAFGAYKYDGQEPVSAQLASHNGSIYGVTGQGGLHECGESGCGTIYKLSRSSDGAVAETILYNFKNIASLGLGPGSNVIIDDGGNLYGVMGGGGAACGCGVVYRLSPTQSGEWNYAVLHTFVGTDGILPNANLTFGPDGNLYGTTVGGGAYGGGVVFQISPQ